MEVVGRRDDLWRRRALLSGLDDSTTRASKVPTLGCGNFTYQWSRKTGAIAAIAARNCRARIGMACLGDFGNHLIAKTATMGSWAAMRSCQIWAAAPSSAWGAGPCTARKASTAVRAPRDMITGKNALGCFSMVNDFILTTSGPGARL